jgi:hypothetical protein
MHAWILLIPAELFVLAFIWECGKAYGESKRLEKERMNEIQARGIRTTRPRIP